MRHRLISLSEVFMPASVMRGSLPHVRWSAVFAGVAVALATHVCLGMFGAALGYGAEAHDSRALGIVAALWAVMVAFTSALMGAIVATRLVAAAEGRGAWLHGTLVWSIALVVGAVLLTSAMAGTTMGVAYAWNGIITPSHAGADTGPGAAIDAAASSAATGSLLGGIAALFGLAGALVGATIGRQAILADTARPATGTAINREKRRENAAYDSSLMPPPEVERRGGPDATVWSDPAFDRRHGVAEDRRHHH
jgi:hypothetical protein